MNVCIECVVGTPVKNNKIKHRQTKHKVEM